MHVLHLALMSNRKVTFSKIRARLNDHGQLVPLDLLLTLLQFPAYVVTAFNCYYSIQNSYGKTMISAVIVCQASEICKHHCLI